MIRLRASIDTGQRMSHGSIRRKDPMADVDKLDRVISTRRYGSVEYPGDSNNRTIELNRSRSPKIGIRQCTGAE